MHATITTDSQIRRTSCRQHKELGQTGRDGYRQFHLYHIPHEDRVTNTQHSRVPVKRNYIGVHRARFLRFPIDTFEVLRRPRPPRRQRFRAFFSMV